MNKLIQIRRYQPAYEKPKTSKHHSPFKILNKINSNMLMILPQVNHNSIVAMQKLLTVCRQLFKHLRIVLWHISSQNYIKIAALHKMMQCNRTNYNWINLGIRLIEDWVIRCKWTINKFRKRSMVANSKIIGKINSIKATKPP